MSPDVHSRPATARRRHAWRAALSVVLAAMVLSAPAGGAGAGASAPVRIDGASAGERAGTAVAAAGDVNGDGLADVIVGAPGALAGAGGTAGGAAYVVFGPFPAGTTIDLAHLEGRGIVLRGSTASAEMAGQSVAAAGDVNGDGLADVVVGAPGATPHQEAPQTHPGHAYIVFGTRTPHDLDLHALGSAGITLTGPRLHFPDAFGWQVAGVGDIDRDGRADVAVAAPGNPGFEDAFTPGSAYVVFGRRAAGAVTMSRLGAGGFRIAPGEVTSIAGAGDWNRDRRMDVAVFTGRAVAVVYGHRYRRSVDLGHLGDRGVTIRPRVPRSLEGAALAGGRDVDGDGRPDLVIGEPQAHYVGLGPANGGAWLVRGSVSRRTVTLAAGSRRAWETAIGGRGWLAGSAVALGRVGSDRRNDTIMVAHGSIAVLRGGPARSRLRLDAMPAARGFLIDGGAEPAAAGSPAGTGGFTAVGAGDLDGDGAAEVLAGAPLAGHQDRPFGGSAYVYDVR
jgi:FG-GAP repeat protein